jgi:glycosyltransferase involved in cell wall biosynthesis
MTKRRVVIISKNEISSWKSCQSIVGNLAKAYLRMFDRSEYLFITVSAEFNAYQSYKVAEQVKKTEAEFIIWIDHSPNPSGLIKALSKEYADISFEARPKFLIHVFGDFVLDCLAWQSIRKDLQVWPVHFIAASHRQQKLIERFLVNSQNVSCLPFPVDESTFNTNELESNRALIREKFKIGPEEKVFLYTGRISYQKNIDVLLKVFNEIQSTIGGKIHLWIAGGFDDILLPYFGKYGVVGSFYSHLAPERRHNNLNVNWLGSCSTDELVGLYHAADVLVSMSTYNDEDYGMSPAEAMCTGLPLLLSSWGGYASFANYAPGVRLIPTTFDSFRPLIDSVQFKKNMMLMAMKDNYSLNVRKKISAEALSNISISAITEQLKKTWPHLNYNSVQSFSELFEQVCVAFKNNKFAPFKNEINENSPSELYKDVYSAYGD